MKSTTVVRDVILVGGGHTHALTLLKWRKNNIPGVRLTLVSPDTYTPYSGMLPGLISGQYGFEDCHIDLPSLCEDTGVRFIQDRVTAIDTDTLHCKFAVRPELGFDLASIDIGSAPNVDAIEHHPADPSFIPVKPIARLWQRLQAINRFRIGVVGAGAGGVELAFALHRRFHSHANCEIHLFHRGDHVLEQYPTGARKRLTEKLLTTGIHVHKQFAAQRWSDGQLLAQDGKRVELDYLFACTPAGAADWPAASGLACDAGGFIEVDASLRSRSHPQIFACGDIASFTPSPLAKAGVYAVRQAPILFDNLCRSLRGQSLRQYKPQHRFLSLLSCADGTAVAVRGKFSGSGAWAWHWKDRIDRGFMQRFREASTMPEMSTAAAVDPTLLDSELSNQIDKLDQRCGGCAAKISRGSLEAVLAKLNGPVDSSAPEDAIVFRDSEPVTRIQSVDQIKQFIGDPYLFGRIAALHAINDCLAMGATPDSSLCLASLPFARSDIVERDLLQLLAGARHSFQEHGCDIVGGHSSETEECLLGFAVNGRLLSEPAWRKSAARQGQKLILTKALGTAIVFAGLMRSRARGAWVEAALESMLRSNSDAVAVFRDAGVSACTDISGFGLLGHLQEILQQSQLGAALQLDRIPLLPGAKQLSAQGIQSSLADANRTACERGGELPPPTDHAAWPLLFDPQTSGALLACVPQDKAEFCTQQLREKGYADARIIGQLSDSAGRIELLC